MGTRETRKAGRVYLVGAGPGDPGLLTVRARQLIEGAEVILYDRLVGAAALEGAPPEAELVFVGKEGGGEAVPQQDIEALMIARAGAGNAVVRLKGGDPFVFGRGGEEASALRAAHIPYEIVPGVTAGIAAPAYAGIPVTHRDLSSAVAFVTGQTRAGEPPAALDWPALAAFPGTLVFYMGVGQLEQIAAALIGAGRAGSEPAAVVEAGTLPMQRTVTGTLETIAASARREQASSPAVIVVGGVASLAKELAWLPARPLAGRTVAVTRARSQASVLSRRLEALGADVVQAPTIRTRLLPGPPLDPSPYDLICVTSPNGVSGCFERLAAGGRDARALAGKTVAAIGPGTALALAERGIAADVVSERSVAEGLVEALTDIPAQRAVLVRASRGRDVLGEALRARGIEVDVLEVYETVAEPISHDALARARTADFITFTSSSTVRFFLEAAAAPKRGDGRSEAPEGFAPHTRIVSIGPATSETLREHGLEPDIEAERHDIDGLLEALVSDSCGGQR